MGVVGLLACASAPTGEELPPEHVDTVGEVWCEEGDALPLGAESRGLTSGVVGVWLEVRPESEWELSFALDEVYYYDWEGRFPLTFAVDCTSALAAGYRMRWRMWDGRDDVVEDLELTLGEAR